MRVWSLMIAVCCSVGGVAVADVPCGEAANGLVCCLIVERTTACPGEPLDFHAVLKNVGTDDLYLPRQAVRIGDRCEGTARTCLLTPAGRTYVYEDPGPRIRLPKMEFDRLAPGWSIPRLTPELYLIDDPAGWKSADAENGELLSCRAPGEYALWVEYAAPPLDDAPAGAWSGRVKSNVVRFTVREMPPGQRRQEPTPEQLADVQAVTETLDLPAIGRVATALQRTENEGLALEVLRHLSEHQPRAGRYAPRWWLPLLGCLSLRACREEAGESRLLIDGPYLRELVELCLQQDELHLAAAATNGTPLPTGPLVAYLRGHPEDTEVRSRAIALARRHAKVGEVGLTPDQTEEQLAGAGYRVYRLAHARLNFAWSVLLAAGELREGMSIEQFEEVLGPPTQVRPDTIEWLYNSPMHVNPYLIADVEAGRVTAIQCGVR
jgi:hypothetical protein